MTEGELRVGLIGSGLAARLHARVFAAIPGTRVTAVCDLDEERARTLAREHGIEASTSSVEQLLGNGLDVAVVLTPPESHADLAIQAFEAGCDVLIEKPFVYTTDEADRVIASAERTGRRFSVIHNELFNPPVFELLERLRGGELGDLVSVQYLSARRDQTFVPSDWYFDTYGGRIGETLPHALCLLVELVEGLEVEWVQALTLGHCVGPTFRQSECGFDELRAQLRSSGGVVASISYSLNSNLRTSLIVSGTKSSLLVQPFGETSSLTSSSRDWKADLRSVIEGLRSRVARRLGRRTKSGVRDSSHYRQVRMFVDDLRTGREFLVSPAKAREVVRLWCAIVGVYEGGKESRPPG